MSVRLRSWTEAEQGDDGFKTKDVVMVRGGLECYLKTFPEGGFWKGIKYLFDKQMEQMPLLKTADLESECCPFSFKCSEV